MHQNNPAFCRCQSKASKIKKTNNNKRQKAPPASPAPRRHVAPSARLIHPTGAPQARICTCRPRPSSNAPAPSLTHTQIHSPTPRPTPPSPLGRAVHAWARRACMRPPARLTRARRHAIKERARAHACRRAVVSVCVRVRGTACVCVCALVRACVRHKSPPTWLHRGPILSHGDQKHRHRDPF